MLDNTDSRERLSLHKKFSSGTQSGAGGRNHLEEEDDGRKNTQSSKSQFGKEQGNNYFDQRNNEDFSSFDSLRIFHRFQSRGCEIV